MVFRFLITGSADGVGLLAAKKLIAQGHRVVLHARNSKRAAEVEDAVPRAERILVGDLSHLEEVKSLAEAANASGPFDAVLDSSRSAEMNLEKLNKICFTICIICIVAGTVLSLAMNWLELQDEKFLWKSWLTIGVFFLASALTLNVNKILARKRRDEA